MSKDMWDWPRANLGVAAYMFKHHCMSQDPGNCQESRHGSSWLLAGMKSFLSDHGLPGSALLGGLSATWSTTFNGTSGSVLHVAAA